MANNRLSFTQDRIRRLSTPVTGRADYHDSGCPKLTCRVNHTGTRSFAVLKKNKSGKVQRITLGRFPDISVSAARELARKTLTDMAQGINPIEKKREERRRGIKLGELLDQYLEQKDLKESTAHDYRKKARQGFSDWLDKPVKSITQDMVLSRHKKLSTGSPTTRDNKFRVLRLLMEYAIATHIIKDSPVNVLRQIKLWSKPKRKTRIIPEDKLTEWYQAVLCLDNSNARLFFLLLLYTGLRSGEAQTLKWADVDFQANTLTVRDTKNHTNFTAYMASQIKPYLREQQDLTGNTPFVFPGAGSKGYMSLPKKPVMQIIKQTGIEFSPHDLRRTFATIAEAASLPETIIKRLLNHTTDNNVTTGYIRTEANTLREATQRIADNIHQRITPDNQNIITLNQRINNEHSL